MVATSLPFWMHQSSRVMSPFPDHPALRADPPASDASSGDGQEQPAPFAAWHPRVEFCDAQAVQAHERAWAALATRALEPNVFLEPGFALPALRHFPPAQRPGFLLVWSADAAGRSILIGLCAVRSSPGAFGPRVTTAWIHEQATTSVPMLDRDRAGEALDRILDDLARRRPDCTGLLLQGVMVDGALMRLLDDRHRRVIELERRERVVLRRPEEGDAVSRHATARRAKEMRRQARRLGDNGVWAYRSAQSVDEVRAATERFLDLEARGWKGGRGTALLNDAGLAAFTRAMTRRLARAGLCRVDTLEIDGQPAAMGVMLRSGDRAFYWKTSYDERWGRHSPGKLLAAMLGQAQLGDPDVALTDSCAQPNHPMIGHVWGDRTIVADVIVAAAAADPRRLAGCVRVIRMWRGSRAAAKGVRNLLRRALQRQA